MSKMIKPFVDVQKTAYITNKFLSKNANKTRQPPVFMKIFPNLTSSANNNVKICPTMKGVVQVSYDSHHYLLQNYPHTPNDLCNPKFITQRPLVKMIQSLLITLQEKPPQPFCSHLCDFTFHYALQSRLTTLIVHQAF